jgi:hypothetical protein
MGLCDKKNKSQYMGVLGYPVVRGIAVNLKICLDFFDDLIYLDYMVFWIYGFICDL